MKKLINKKKIIAILIVASFLTVSMIIKLSFKKPEQKKEEPKRTETTKERNIDGVKHVQDMRVRIDMPESIKKKIDYSAFTKDFEKFLDENKLMTDNTTARAYGTVTEDVNSGDIIFDLKLNNTSGTIITVTIKKNGKIKYEYLN